MGETFLARWQFGLTSTYHWLFVPLTLGLTVFIAIMEVIYVRTGNEMYKKMAQFWGKLFLINFAMGVVTGIVQEFHFGMNWSEYSRFMGDIFGAPLALEALTAFFLESTFIGIWIFGWDRLSPKLHATAACLVAFGTNLSAFWILVANSFMQHPVGFALRNGRAEMTDFGALLTNGYVFHQFPHVVLAGITTAGAFIAAISAWQLLRKNQVDFFHTSLKSGVALMVIGAVLVAGIGHLQARYIAKVQPMKLAAAEALWETSDSAPFSLFAAINEEKQSNAMELAVPGALSFLVYDSFQGKIQGIKELQHEMVQKFGPGDYIPPVTPIFWSFRLMVISGLWMIGIGLLSWYLVKRNQLTGNTLVLKALFWTLPVSYIANATGWYMAEAGRQPWLVVGLQTTYQGVSPNVTAAEIWTTMVGFTLVYAVIAAAAVYLAKKVIVKGVAEQRPTKIAEVKGATLWS